LKIAHKKCKLFFFCLGTKKRQKGVKLKPKKKKKKKQSFSALTPSVKQALCCPTTFRATLDDNPAK